MIESARLILRELEVGDCSPAYAEWLADPAVNRFLETRHAAQTPIAIREFVAAMRARDDVVLFGMFLREDGRHVGNIKVGPIDPRHRLADVSLFLGDRACWGRGYATEAIAAVSRYAFDRLAIAKLSASMYATNRGSTAAFLKAGYRQEGWRRDHYLLEGERTDLVELGLVSADLA